MKYIVIISLFLMTTDSSTLHDFKIDALNSDNKIAFSDFKGKKILVVNVASKCGYTPQYEGLQELYSKYQDKLVVIGFPCNQFGGQEPGSENLIQEFCSSTYGVSFPMTTKVDVKGGNQHEIYKWLTSKELNGVGDFSIRWNFNKFLIDENGNLIKYFPSSVKPMSSEIIDLL